MKKLLLISMLFLASVSFVFSQASEVSDLHSGGMGLGIDYCHYTAEKEAFNPNCIEVKWLNYLFRREKSLHSFSISMGGGSDNKNVNYSSAKIYYGYQRYLKNTGRIQFSLGGKLGYCFISEGDNEENKKDKEKNPDKYERSGLFIGGCLRTDCYLSNRLLLSLELDAATIYYGAGLSFCYMF